MVRRFCECFMPGLSLSLRPALVALMPPPSTIATAKKLMSTTHIRSQLWLMHSDSNFPHKAEPNPQLAVGDEVKGTVTRVAPYGAFVRLPDGQTGLIHISEIADTYIKSIGDHVSRGEQVTVRVLSIDFASRKISLSIRQSLSKRASGYDRVVELGGDWGNPWNDDGNTTFLQLSTTPPPVQPHHWEPDLSLFEPFDEDDIEEQRSS